jgi:hypothetical protein
MLKIPKRRSLLIVSVVVLCLAIFGCREKQLNYVPTLSVSEGALAAALDAWKAGLPAGEIPNTKPLVHVTDQNRNPAQKLESYNVVGEVPGSAGRTFVVNLHLTNPTEEIKTQYIVVGIEPIWVFRQEDYELLMHWDHHMPSKSGTQAVAEDKNEGN